MMSSHPHNWLFTQEELVNSPSHKCGIDAEKELSYRQLTANLISDLAKKLQLSTLVANTAVVYMHRFYMHHSFTNFPWQNMATACLFLSSKVEEQPRKLEHFIKLLNSAFSSDPASVNLDVKSEQYNAQLQDLIFNEHILLLTLGFDVAVDHPHATVVKSCQMIKAPNDLSKMSYMIASFSIHVSTMCVQYPPTVVACFCIYLASKWSQWEIQKSNEQKHWFTYVDKTVTEEFLQKLTCEFLVIIDKCPSRMKKKFHVPAIQITDSSSPQLMLNHMEVQKKKSEANDQKHTPTNNSQHPYHQSYQKPDKHLKVPNSATVPLTNRAPTNVAVPVHRSHPSNVMSSGHGQKAVPFKPSSHPYYHQHHQQGYHQNIPHNDAKSQMRVSQSLQNNHDKHSSVSNSHRSNVSSLSGNVKENSELKRPFNHIEHNDKKDAHKVRLNHGLTDDVKTTNMAFKPISANTSTQNDLKNPMIRSSEINVSTTMSTSATTMTTTTTTISINKYYEKRSMMNASKVKMEPAISPIKNTPEIKLEPQLPLQSQSETESTISSILKDAHKNADYIKPFDCSNRIVNGIETDPKAISSLLKESSSDPSISALSLERSKYPLTITSKIESTDEDMKPFITPYETYLDPNVQPEEIQEESNGSTSISQSFQHLQLAQSLYLPKTTIEASIAMHPVADDAELPRHDKKKKKEKRKHKHHDKNSEKSKNRDRTKEEKKRKHKDKHRHRSKDSKAIHLSCDSGDQDKVKLLNTNSEPVTLNPTNQLSTSIKIKIPKERIKPELAVSSPNSSESSESLSSGSGLKIKIKKDRIKEILSNADPSTLSNINPNLLGFLPMDSDVLNNRKRDRGKISPSALSKHHHHHHHSEPPTKIMKVHSSNQTYDSIKSFERNNFQKISEHTEGINKVIMKSNDSKSHRTNKNILVKKS